MITKELIMGILSIYEKHGWNLSRVLLCDEVKNALDNKDLTELFSDAVIKSSDINAVWFSRLSKHGKTAWELRYLHETPFAIFELFDENTDETTKTEVIKKAEQRLKDFASNNTGVKKV